MSSVQPLRELINERLTAAAEEILTVFEGTIVRYEEEIDRQRRLLEIFLKPEIQLHRIDLPQQHDCKEEEVLTDQQLSNQERNPCLDQQEPEAPQIKQEQEELCTSQEGEQLVLKLEIDTFMVTPTSEEHNLHDPEPNSDQPLSHSSHVADSQAQTRSNHVDLGSRGNAVLKPKKRHHKNTSPSNNAANSPLSESQGDNNMGEKIVKCDVCAKSLKNKYGLKKHYRIHTGEKPFSCKICGKSFSQSGDLTVHRRTHTGEKPFSCKTCGKSFIRSGKLARHIRTHTGEKPFSCETCGKCFSRNCVLLLHMRTHTGEKAYFCETCGKSFSHRCTLVSHMRTHTGEKLFSCKICGKDFITKSHLTVHMRMHTDEKPYPCETCGKGFSSKSYLTVHMRVHTDKKL